MIWRWYQKRRGPKIDQRKKINVAGGIPNDGQAMLYLSHLTYSVYSIMLNFTLKR